MTSIAEHCCPTLPISAVIGTFSFVRAQMALALAPLSFLWTIQTEKPLAQILQGLYNACRVRFRQPYMEVPYRLVCRMNQAHPQGIRHASHQWCIHKTKTFHRMENAPNQTLPATSKRLTGNSQSPHRWGSGMPRVTSRRVAMEFSASNATMGRLGE